MRNIFTAIVPFLYFTGAALPVTIDSSPCIVLFEDKERLECFDKAVIDRIEGKGGSHLAATTSGSKTLQEPASEPIKIVDPADVRATPSKWQDRKIQFGRVNVYWVSDDDVRILTGAGVTLFAERVLGPSDAIEFFKRECETSKEANSAKCRATVKFSYYEHSTDSPGGLRKRTVLSTKDLEFVRPPQRRR